MDVTGYPIYLHVQTNVEANRYRPVMTILFIFGMFTRLLDVIRVCFIPKAPFQSHFRMMLMSLLKSSPGRCDSWQDDVAITHLNFSPEYEKANGSKLLTFLVVQKRLLQVIQQQSSSNLSKFGIKGRIARCTNRNSFYASWFVLNIYVPIAFWLQKWFSVFFEASRSDYEVGTLQWLKLDSRGLIWTKESWHRRWHS